ncbi:MAG: hypothetical protein AAF970_00025 [Bacteroidota bacterium]
MHRLTHLPALTLLIVFGFSSVGMPLGHGLVHAVKHSDGHPCSAHHGHAQHGDTHHEVPAPEGPLVSPTPAAAADCLWCQGLFQRAPADTPPSAPHLAPSTGGVSSWSGSTHRVASTPYLGVSARAPPRA